MLMNKNGEVMINQCIYGHTMFRQSRMKICEISTEILVFGHVQDISSTDGFNVYLYMYDKRLCHRVMVLHAYGDSY